MRIDVCSQAAALRLASDAAEKSAILSITSKGEPDVGFADNPNIVSILHLKFNDLSEECDEEGIPYGRPLPVQEDFAGLKAFADGLSCEQVIVHSLGRALFFGVSGHQLPAGTLGRTEGISF